MPRLLPSCSLTQSSQNPTAAKPPISTMPGHEKRLPPSKRSQHSDATRIAATTNTPPIVGVPCLCACSSSSRCEPVPSTRSPTPSRRSQRITRGPSRIANRNAVTAAPAVRKEM